MTPSESPFTVSHDTVFWQTAEAGELRRRLARKTTHDPQTGCDEWSGNVKDGAYPRLMFRGVSYAVRALTMQLGGKPVPGRHFVRATCGNGRCVNPAHTEALPNAKRLDGVPRPDNHKPLTPARVEELVERDPNSGCWLWAGALSASGYGKLTVQYRDLRAHRAFYEHFVGPIPTGLVLDHKCRTRCCVNPQHLEAVTQRENTLRSPTSPSAVNSRKTHCVRGHEFSAANTRTAPDGSRSCRACQRHHATRYRAKVAA